MAINCVLCRSLLSSTSCVSTRRERPSGPLREGTVGLLIIEYSDVRLSRCANVHTSKYDMHADSGELCPCFLLFDSPLVWRFDPLPPNIEARVISPSESAMHLPPSLRTAIFVSSLVEVGPQKRRTTLERRGQPTQSRRNKTNPIFRLVRVPPCPPLLPPSATLRCAIFGVGRPARRAFNSDLVFTTGGSCMRLVSCWKGGGGGVGEGRGR